MFAAPLPDSSSRQLLAEALVISRDLMSADLKSGPEIRSKRQSRLRQIREMLKEFAHPIYRDRLPIDQIPLEIREAFVRATLLATRYSQIGGNNWHGTLPSLTLSQYQTDPVAAELRSPEVLDRLVQLFGLSNEARIEIKHTVEAVDRQISRQKRIIHAALNVDSNADSDRDRNLKTTALFRHLFGDIPLPSAALKYVYTDTQIYFCIDYDVDRLCDPVLWQTLNPTEQSHLQGFLQSLGEFSFDQFQRFPIFSVWNSENIDRAWCDRISQQTGCTTAEVYQSLVRSVNVIPTHKAEALLLHDIWGHHWQLMLTQFDSDYTILSTCSESLRASETAYTPEGPLTCRELFNREGNTVRIDVDRSRLFFHGEVQQRLGLLFTHLIGEIVADVAEFKFVWDHPQLTEKLLSSSIFKSEPTKLDLSLGDIDFLFLKVLQPLLELKLSIFSESRLESDLLAEWQDADLELKIGLKQSIAHLYQIFLSEYNSTYLPTMTGNIGIFTQVVSNLLYLQNAIDTLYKDLIATTQSDIPFQDLLIVFIGCYCSRDSYADFWQIDDVLAAYFLPCWQILNEFVDN